MPTLEQARQIQTLVDHGLIGGGRNLNDKTPIEGHVCVEQAVCLVLYGTHCDTPDCVSPLVARFKRMLNDNVDWKDNADRAAGLRRIAIAQLGSTHIDEEAFRKVVGGYIINDFVYLANAIASANAAGTVPQLIEAAIAELRRQRAEGVALLDQLEA